MYRTLNIIDEFTREALMIRVKRKLNSTDVVDALTDLFILRGPPELENPRHCLRHDKRDNLKGTGSSELHQGQRS